MKIMQAAPERDGETGRLKILVEIDSNDVKIIEQALLLVEQEGRFDKDDHDYITKFNHVKDVNHKVRGILWPS